MAERRTWAGAISSPEDVRVALNRAAETKAGTSALAKAVTPAADTELQPDASKLLLAAGPVRPLLPWPGLRRGATIAVTGSVSLLHLVMQGAMTHGAWAAVAGMPTFGVLAAAEAGVAVDRLALIPAPGPDWPTVVGALLDGVDLVVASAPGEVSDRVVRSLQSRARQRGAVLIPTRSWPGSDLVLEATARTWHGLGQGRGRLRWQDVAVTATGRGKAARPKTATIALPAGRQPQPIVIPAPVDVGGEPTLWESPLWRGLNANEGPADLWGDLTDAAPRPERKRR